MGLSLAVGYFADNLSSGDDEEHQLFREEMVALNQFIVSQGLAPHDEPESCESFSCDLYGYSGLHYLRRIAAHLALGGDLAPPGGEDAADDPVLQEYCNRAFPQKHRLFQRLLRRRPRHAAFDHLIFHSDCEGYYLPQDFPEVLFAQPNMKIPGGMIGSSIRLRDECQRLAAALQLPLDPEPHDEDVRSAVESQGQGDGTWERYGMESYTCIQLYQAALHSIRHGAAIVFC